MKILTTLPGVIFVTGLLITGNVHAQEPADPQTSVAASPAPQKVNATGAMDQLEAAYQKEYAFLEAQLRDLRKRSSDFDAEANRDEADKQAKIDRVEGEWINLQSEADRTQALLNDADRELESVEDARTTLEATFLQAESTLEPFQLEALSSGPYTTGSDGQRIEILFGQALGLLTRISRVSESAGTFFLTDGTEVSGRILRIGNIAAYGISDNGSGALAPAGEGRLKIWPKPTASAAESLANGRTPALLDVFLFESENSAIEEHAGKTLLGVINSGGSIAWIIVALGAVGLVLVFFRFMFLRNAGAATGKIVEQVGALVRKGKIAEALETCKKFKGATARVVWMAVSNLERDRAHLEDIISEAILHESSHLNRFGAMILVIAAVAPLLGLLGTVTGMITTFDIITEFGTGDPKLLSGGISIALVTTEVGLAVAIPALLAGNILSGWSESIKDDMEKGALGVINQYKEHRRTV
ncbi:MAG: MotA/TolQ/ExbB proton channel family protein [Lysobacterales bacterium]